MVNYKTSIAFDWLKDYQKKMGASDFAIVKVRDDNKEYQVKFNQSNSRELIAHYIAMCIGVPVPDAKIIHIPDNIFSDIKSIMKNIEPFESKYYFAVEWKKTAIKWKDYTEFFSELKNVQNFTQFLSIFPFDQYLRNYDRHEFNHMILREKSKSLFYNSIDADRIFGGYDYKDILCELNNYNCHYPKTHGKVLYSVINDKSFETILKYSGLIGVLDKDDISDIIDICSKLYDIKDFEIKNIETFLINRKDKIYDNCLKNSVCFDNVSRRLHAN